MEPFAPSVSSADAPPISAEPADAMTWRNLLHALVPRPFLIIGLFALGVAAGVSLPLMLALPPYGQQTIDQQIGSENSALCASFGFTPGTSPEGACEASLTEMRHRHEATLRY